MFLDFAGRSIQLGGARASIAGAYVKDQCLELAALAAETFEDWEYEVGRLQGFLIGLLPGQIVAWPSEQFPRDWRPSWAIKMHKRKKWKAIYIGEMFEATSLTTPNTPTRRNIKEWKKVAWHWRKRILLPKRQDARALWHQMQEVARNV